ncbi:hypothetical protein [Streptomyces sp. P17]|uniref:hypothetical protein n=1 Tax=Streptomyces sp. P17 TaxID=3074716 RepID=UPI0028F45CF0|nr:hypothetical protein [Streptomyces sp. P17]MDT9701941.1 hypothetical protein [Streptomyces sp. P17]
MNNSKNYDLRICVESICKVVRREINYARLLRHDVFESDEEFRLYFGLRNDAPALRIITEQPQ